MGMYDRDWYRESYKEKEEKYGGDFSLHSKPKKKHQKRKADKAKNNSTYQGATYRNSAKQNTTYQNSNAKQDDSLLPLINISCPILFVITLLWGYKFIPNGLVQIALALIFLCTPAVLREPKGTRLKSILKAFGIFFITLIGGLIIGISIVLLLQKYGILQF